MKLLIIFIIFVCYAYVETYLVYLDNEQSLKHLRQRRTVDDNSRDINNLLKYNSENNLSEDEFSTTKEVKINNYPPNAVSDFPRQLLTTITDTPESKFIGGSERNRYTMSQKEEQPSFITSPSPSQKNDEINEEYINLDTSTATNESLSCHEECLSVLDKVSFSMDPNSTLIKGGSSLTMECSFRDETNSSSRLIWLFQGTNPPMSQCSLTFQETLAMCDTFNSIDHTVDTNITSGFTKEIITLNSLEKQNSGFYYCMVELSCCSNSHTMDRTTGPEKPVIIYFEDYDLEFKVLISLTVVLLVLIVAGMVVERWKRVPFYKSLLVTETVVSLEVKHAPILQDEDSFAETDDEG